MKRMMLTALAGLVAMFSMAAGFRTVRLSEIARATDLPVRAMQGSTEDISYRSHPLRVCYNGTGDISHIGYRIFTDAQLEFAAPRGILLYLERYLLETDIPHLGGSPGYTEELTVQEGELSMLFSVTEETPISVMEKRRQKYRLSFAVSDGTDLVIDVKATSQFILGADIVELERIAMRDIQRMPRLLPPYDWSGESAISIGDRLLLCRESAFLDNAIRSDVYLTEFKDGRRTIYCDTKNPWRSMANVVLTGDVPFPVPMKLHVRSYEENSDTILVTLQQFIGFCRDEDCTLYFGIKGQDSTMVHATLYALSNPLSFCHVISMDIPQTLTEDVMRENVETPICCTLYSYVPLHYMDENFFQIPDNQLWPSGFPSTEVDAGHTPCYSTPESDLHTRQSDDI